MTRIAYYVVLVMVVVTMSATAPMASARTQSSPPNVAPMSHTLCDYVTDGYRPLLVPGSRGNAVMQAQCLINIYSFYPRHYPRLKVDGIFGPLTKRAAIWVQDCARTHGLPRTYVDGKVGSQTWNILYNQPSACGTRPIGDPH